MKFLSDFPQRLIKYSLSSAEQKWTKNRKNPLKRVWTLKTLKPQWFIMRRQFIIFFHNFPMTDFPVKGDFSTWGKKKYVYIAAPVVRISLRVQSVGVQIALTYGFLNGQIRPPDATLSVFRCTNELVRPGFSNYSFCQSAIYLFRKIKDNNYHFVNNENSTNCKKNSLNFPRLMIKWVENGELIFAKYGEKTTAFRSKLFQVT